MTYIMWAWIAAHAALGWFPLGPFDTQEDCGIALHAMTVAHPDAKFKCLPEGEKPTS